VQHSSTRWPGSQSRFQSGLFQTKHFWRNTGERFLSIMPDKLNVFHKQVIPAKAGIQRVFGGYGFPPSRE